VTWFHFHLKRSLLCQLREKVSPTFVLKSLHHRTVTCDICFGTFFFGWRSLPLMPSKTDMCKKIYVKHRLCLVHPLKYIPSKSKIGGNHRTTRSNLTCRSWPGARTVQVTVVRPLADWINMRASLVLSFEGKYEIRSIHLIEETSEVHIGCRPVTSP